MATQVRSNATPLPAVSPPAAGRERRQPRQRDCLRQKPRQLEMAPAIDHQHVEQAPSGEVAQAFTSRDGADGRRHGAQGRSCATRSAGWRSKTTSRG